KIKIIGLIGPPGAGKGTQCSLLRRDLHFQHLSIRALMREESNRPDNIHAAIIRANQVSGKLNPKELSIPLLLKNIYAASQSGTYLYVLDGLYFDPRLFPADFLRPGFPRDLDQIDYFARKFKLLSLVILLECSEQVYIDRLLRRGRFDDNAESIK
ncbi:P-loop containing nucleoside triphosphate hydrolase protein, partial [Cadophora sp. MPI-SDFR-AT-0126]